MALKKSVFILASVAVIIACGSTAWSTPTRSNNSTSSTTLRLLVSNSMDRSNAKSLYGTNLNGEVAIFTNRPSRARSVAFYLDDPKMLKSPRQIEYSWPFDFAGTAQDGTARLFNTAIVDVGRHVVTAKAILTNGRKIVASASFYIVPTSTAPTSTAPTSTAPDSTAPNSTAPTSTAPTSPTSQPVASQSTSTATTNPSTSPRTGAFPNPASTGVPAGWAPKQTTSSDLTVTTDGAIVEDIRFTNGASIVVKADDVTIRRVDLQGGIISNQFGDAPAGCGHNLLVEDTTFERIPGTFKPDDYPVLGEGSYTARRIEVDGRGEGPRLSDCGPVTLEDSFIRIHGADPGTAACDQVHSDGVQAFAGVGATARNNTIIMQTPCGTSPWFVVNPSVNTGQYHIDGLLVGGGGFSFRQQVSASVTGLRIVDKSWVYGPLDEMDCSVISPWDAKVVTIDSSYQVTGIVRDQQCRN
jgi:hypothetical protein